MIGILALQGDIREHGAALRASGAEWCRVRNREDLDRADALILPGGESTTMTKLALDLGLFSPIVSRIRAGMPAYGSCAGMIMLADRVVGGAEGQQTIGGIDMTVRRNAFGRQVDSFESDVSMPVIGQNPVRAVFIRAPWVERVGAGVEILARAVDPAGVERIVAVRQGPLLATSFHPELTGDRRVHDLFVGMVRKSQEVKE